MRWCETSSLPLWAANKQHACKYNTTYTVESNNSKLRAAWHFNRWYKENTEINSRSNDCFNPRDDYNENWEDTCVSVEEAIETFDLPITLDGKSFHCVIGNIIARIYCIFCYDSAIGFHAFLQSV